MATNAIMLNNTSGPGGTPLTGNHPANFLAPNPGDTSIAEPYLAPARRTGEDSLSLLIGTAVTCRFPLVTPMPGPGNEARVSTDRFLLDKGTNQWMSAHSFHGGVTLDRLFFGGTQIGGVLAFALDEHGFLTNFVSLGQVQAGGVVAGYFAPPRNPAVFPFPEDEWFKIMFVQTQSPGGGLGQGWFVTTAGAVAAGVLDPRLAAGDIIPTDSIPLGWLNIFPGVVDDPLTQAVEGVGPAASAEGVLAQASGALGMAPLLSGSSIDAFTLGEGLDPPAPAVPGFQIEDAFLDNLTVARPDGGRIVNIMLGGPNVNERFNLQNPPFGSGLIPPTTSADAGDDMIWVTEPSGVSDPDFQYAPTHVRLLTSGTVAGGSLTGPFVNTWFTVRARVFSDDMWEVAIDEGAGFVTIASGEALDAGAAGQTGVVNTTGVGSFTVNVGNDLGAGGANSAGGPIFPSQRWFFDDVSIAVNTGCPEDLNRDGVVNGSDVSFILNTFGAAGAGLPVDLNGDGAVNGGDIGNILNAFGPCP